MLKAAEHLEEIRQLRATSARNKRDRESAIEGRVRS